MATVGLGLFQKEEINAPYEKIWTAMVDKVYNTSKYVPVTNVSTVEKDGYVYREMTYMGNVKKENIFLKKDEGEILFELVDVDEIIYNKFHKDSKKLEYFMTNRKGERKEWPISVDIIYKAMTTTKQNAEA